MTGIHEKLRQVLLLTPALVAHGVTAQGFEAVEATRKPPEGTAATMSNSTEVPQMKCATTVPYMGQIVFSLGRMGLFRQICLGINIVFFICTLLIFVEACIFCKKAFKHNYERRRRTMWICGLWPVMSMSGMLGIFFPRSAPIVDLMAGAYMGSCLFQVVELLLHYMGGKKNMWDIIEPKQKRIPAQSLPFCCFFFCLPIYTFTRKRYNMLVFWVFQCGIVRPLMMFVTAALWANQSYQPGVVSLTNAFAYVKVITIISTFSAMYCLAQIRNGFIPELMGVAVIGKVTAVQLSVMLTVVVDILISIFLAAGAIPCNAIMPAFVNASTIFHGCLITIMLPMAIMGRKHYRCIPDAMWKPPQPPQTGESMALKAGEDGGEAVKPPAGPPPGTLPPHLQKCAFFRP